MAKFEGYERREAKILAALKKFGISSIDECMDICKAQGIMPMRKSKNFFLTVQSSIFSTKMGTKNSLSILRLYSEVGN